MKEQRFKDGEVVEWRALDEAGKPVGETQVVRYTESGMVEHRPRSESTGSLSCRKETNMDIAESAVASPGHSQVSGPLLKVQAAAEYLAISTRQVQYLSQRGELPCVRMGTSTRYRVADLESFISRCRRKGGHN
jgi:excisionase family DNA binding protein